MMEFSYSNLWIVTSKLFILQNQSVETVQDIKLHFFILDKNFKPHGKF